jgi:hypothetical protein
MLRHYKIRNFCDKLHKDFDFEKFIKEKRHKPSEATEEPKVYTQRVKSPRSHIYFESKRNYLANAYKDELNYFKLESDFEINNLRHRYLEFGKLSYLYSEAISS